MTGLPESLFPRGDPGKRRMKRARRGRVARKDRAKSLGNRGPPWGAARLGLRPRRAEEEMDRAYGPEC